MNKGKQAQTNADIETKLFNIEKHIANFDHCIAYISSSQHENEFFSNEVKKEYKLLLFLRDHILGQASLNKPNNQSVEILKKSIDMKVDKFRAILMEKLQRMNLIQKMIDEKNRLNEIKQIIQSFIAKSNELSGLEANISMKKKNKNEKSEKTLLLEKIDLFKKKLESEKICSSAEQQSFIVLFLEKMIADIDNIQLQNEFDKIFDYLEENFNVLVWDQTKKYRLEQEDINMRFGMIESRAPINEMDSYQKTDKKTNKNYETNNNPSEFSKREENNTNYLMKMLETSFTNMPETSDYFPTETGKETNYPKSLFPKRRYISERSFEKMDIETLFFIFYFQKGTYEQLVAARQLKTLGWRYHKKYLTWFKRLEEPRESTEEFEKGTYAFFDHEKGWNQKKKNDFTFKYQYLEDE